MTGRTARAYLDRPVTDLAAASAVAHRAAAHWGLDEPDLLRCGMNAIFVTDHEVLRVGTPNAPATSSLDLAEFLASLGLRVPRPVRYDVVDDGDLSVTCWERLRPIDGPIDWSSIGTMVRTLHAIEPATLPAGVPVPTPDALPWWDFESMLARVGAALDGPARHGLEAAIDRHRGWQELDVRVVCHGDVHPGNVMMTSTGAVLMDWDLLCWAPPGWDHAPMLTWATRWGGDAGAYDAFADGYGESLATDVAAVAFAELRLVAATLLRLVTALSDPTAMPEAQRRLGYWRGDADAPMWTAQ